MRSAAHLVSLSFSFVVITIITTGAFVLLLTDLWSDRIYGGNRTFFICLLFAYAIYRGFRIYQSIKRARYEEEE